MRSCCRLSRCMQCILVQSLKPPLHRAQHVSQNACQARFRLQTCSATSGQNHLSYVRLGGPLCTPCLQALNGFHCRLDRRSDFGNRNQLRRHRRCRCQCWRSHSQRLYSKSGSDQKVNLGLTLLVLVLCQHRMSCSRQMYTQLMAELYQILLWKLTKQLWTLV